MEEKLHKSSDYKEKRRFPRALISLPVDLWEDWEEYQYGLKFVEILNEDHLKLKWLLRGRSNLEEASFKINNSGVSI